MIESPAASARGSARVPGSCGELVQGSIDGDYFLVSCPIDMYSTATVELTDGSDRVYAPKNAPKSRRAVELTLARFGRCDLDAHLSLSSQLPRGKGMASSTADVSAAIAATSVALGEEEAMPPAEIARAALLIEPSDGVMLPGISRFDHRRGNSAVTLGSPPPMRIVVLDFGGTVDTIAFNSVDRGNTLQCLQPKFEEALAFIVNGIDNGNLKDIGAGATLSAVTNQKMLYKPQLDSVLRIADEVGALGVNVAHSGTVLGILFEDDMERTRHGISRAQETLSGIRKIYDRRIVGGGVVSVVKSHSHMEAL